VEARYRTLLLACRVMVASWLSESATSSIGTKASDRSKFLRKEGNWVGEGVLSLAQRVGWDFDRVWDFDDEIAVITKRIWCFHIYYIFCFLLTSQPLIGCCTIKALQPIRIEGILKIINLMFEWNNQKI
jgi:hypothetical protein